MGGRLRRGVRAGLGIGALALALACHPQPEAGPSTAPTDEAGAEPSPPSLGRDDEFALPYGDKTIYVYADPELGPEVERLFALFEDFRLEAVALSPTTRLPIGWTTLGFVVEGEQGERLVVTEPNYDDEPETQQRQDISVSLATLARQRRVLEQVGVPGAAIDFDQHVLAIQGAIDEPEVMLIRVESPGGRMTGWRLTPAAGIAEDDEIESLPVHAIVRARPELLDAMLLPPGYLALYSGTQLTTIVNADNVVVWDWTVDGDRPRAEVPALIPVGDADTEGDGDQPVRRKPLLEPID